MNRHHGLLLAALVTINAAAEPALAPMPPMPGSYQAAEVNEEVRGIARFAVREARRQTGGKLKLLAVLGCERQVVAGMNYRLRLKLRRAGEPALASALVFAALDGSHTLVTWQWEDAAR